ncbi:DUF916 and DUF3324 domain-containing protein [Schleiferilactobacillus shenzhenensis]|uniref:Uncharacterized protein n=1 Tax=Schleiferilactobacillus shenzhenensis LY-73 TaxID=1231336 RepID=U4TQB1_9LACO|nr:DUF916 and DUF3324 domain-containing protein [Schleiferilactobacillus shenzhenensis]ERL63712.1 hypothetical protein L248_2252 [Schleiferilactobacillus shenzhenensis LY-73]
MGLLNQRTSRRTLSWLVFFSFIFTVWFIGRNPQSAVAAEMDVKSAPFTVTPVYPSQQSAGGNVGFDLLMTPGQTVSLDLKVRNKTEKVQRAVITPTFATTSYKGTIDYQQFNAKPDSTLVHPLTTLGPRKQTVSLPPGKTILVKQNVTIPSSDFNGVILGGFDIRQKDQPTKALKKSGRVAITNDTAYLVSTLILVGKTESVKPDFKLNRVGPTTFNARPAVEFNLQNTQAMYVSNKGLSVTAKVTPRGSRKTVIALNQAMSYAPNSNATVPMVFDGRDIPSGNFTLHLVAKTDEQTWRFTRNFTISADTASRLNRANVTAKPNYLWLWIVIGLLVLLFVVVIIVFLYRRGVRRGKELSQSSRAEAKEKGTHFDGKRSRQQR